MSRQYGVLLTQEGLSELAPVLKDYWHEGVLGKYLSCKEANPDRNYLRVIAESPGRDGKSVETEIYIPHRYIKVVVAGTDHKHIGFV